MPMNVRQAQIQEQGQVIRQYDVEVHGMLLTSSEIIESSQDDEVMGYDRCRRFGGCIDYTAC